ncbi:hypothetical protein QTP70_010742 [Hemibagrus guttatus]|uniref:Reverse transcriptase domain-containing protein n=1 Tax=Hemibagrus guttatus TaxID=175788 RepID=A0AAE0Q8P7_9TELE|nr:hypothetical protein QTP70_010742 [Hemibagrus guttatus]KAK3542083.1 hypothetical protein QTP86_012131 [Hemibagrus guttatus]
MQFAYHPNRSTDDAISTTHHLSLTHLENKDTYVQMLFIDFNSAFNTIIPQHLTEKLSLLGINTSLCNWILDFLTGRPLSIQIGNSTSSTTTLNTGAPQGWVLSPLLFALLTHDYAAMHSSNHIIKFADDTNVVGLISKNDESAYREEVQRLTWCKANILSLNMEKMKEMVVDFRRAQSDHSLLNINGSHVEIVKSTKFLCVYLAEDLTWSLNTRSITKKAQQHLYFLQRLRKAHLPPLILTTFYRGTIKNILSSCITAWFGNCTISDRKTLQRIVRTAEISLPSIMDIYSIHCIRKANSIVDDPTHPSHTLFTLLPSGKRAPVEIGAIVGGRSRGGRRVHRQREKRKGKNVGLRIGTLNGTITGKGRELADMMERRKVDVLCVQETRWKGSKAHSIGAGFKLFYYGVDSKRNGVGVVLKEEFVRNVLEVKRVSNRMMTLKLEIEGVMLNVFSGYAPQVGCELEEKERFWSELDEVMESIPMGERVVIGADFNGHVGEGNTGDEEVMGKFGVKERNLEGQMVVDFAKRMDMAVVNTYFQKREE